MKRSQTSYPDRSEVIAQKSAGRERRAHLTFAEKLVLLDELKERTQPIVQSRLLRNQQSEIRESGLFRSNHSIGSPKKIHTESQTARWIRAMARACHVVYSKGRHDELAHHITRLAGDVVQLDDIEELLFALQRAGHLTRTEVIQWQAQYLHESGRDI